MKNRKTITAHAYVKCIKLVTTETFIKKANTIRHILLKATHKSHDIKSITLDRGLLKIKAETQQIIGAISD